MPGKRTAQEAPLTALAQLLHKRRGELDESMLSIIRRSGLPGETIYGTLRRRRPYHKRPPDDMIKGLAAGFRLDPPVVAEAVYQSMEKITDEIRGNPLQLLVIRKRQQLGLTMRQVSERANAAGYPLSEAALGSIEKGIRVKVRDQTLRALSAGLELDIPTVRQAANRAAGENHWTLPAHMQSRMTDKRWRALMGIAEALLAEPE